MTELLPCSKCRRVPTLTAWGNIVCPVRCSGLAPFHGESPDEMTARWNRTYGAPLTLAEKPQDVAMCEDEPSVGDGVREVVPTCDGKRWRECGDPLARWSVMACSGGG